MYTATYAEANTYNDVDEEEEEEHTQDGIETIENWRPKLARRSAEQR